MTTVPHIQIIIGSTREQRRGEAIAQWLHTLAITRDAMSCELVDLAVYDLPFLSGATPPMSQQSREPDARDWSTKIADGDGYVFVVPEHNHGYPASLKNALDHLFSEWHRKPAAFVSYGGLAGGVRATEQLRQVVIELGMAPIRRHLAISRVWTAVTPEGGVQGVDPDEALAVLAELTWWSATLRDGRDAHTATTASGAS
jgi:NAD(P)H-dependent FMN reductase